MEASTSSVLIDATSGASLTMALSDYVKVSFVFYFLVILVLFYFVAISFYKR